MSKLEKGGADALRGWNTSLHTVKSMVAPLQPHQRPPNLPAASPTPSLASSPISAPVPAPVPAPFPVPVSAPIPAPVSARNPTSSSSSRVVKPLPNRPKVNPPGRTAPSRSQSESPIIPHNFFSTAPATREPTPTFSPVQLEKESTSYNPVDIDMEDLEADPHDLSSRRTRPSTSSEHSSDHKPSEPTSWDYLNSPQKPSAPKPSEPTLSTQPPSISGFQHARDVGSDQDEDMNGSNGSSQQGDEQWGESPPASLGE
ncbi:hypothetical protein BDN72DRAFT_906692 [Pluteus cervinus]|uniref:Uncharacterized protein n=1 Tax=Pluteus cervinus TaxID=181527 RepID=A0ACD3A0R3_9AGAR|nr:hypothetical protein BDN72DRAFT_906692 [Pluteus cervinus]